MKLVKSYYATSQLLNRIVAVKVCDARNDDSIPIAWPQKNYHIAGCHCLLNFFKLIFLTESNNRI